MLPRKTRRQGGIHPVHDTDIPTGLAALARETPGGQCVPLRVTDFVRALDLDLRLQLAKLQVKDWFIVGRISKDAGARAGRS